MKIVWPYAKETEKDVLRAKNKKYFIARVKI